MENQKIERDSHMNKKDGVYFLECLAKGLNPFTGKEIDNDSIINDVKFVRKFYELRDFLQENIEEDVESKAKKVPFVLKTKEGIATRPMPISNFVDKINEVNLEENMKKMTRTAIMDWLYGNDYLALDEDNSKYITEKGINAGIYYDHRISSSGREYDVITYPVNLLNSILDLIESGELFSDNLISKIVR